MRIALDSNRYTDFCRGEETAVEVVRSAREIHLPLIVLAELRAGFAHGGRREANERILTRFLNVERVEVLLPDVLQHDLVLFDRDAHFDHVPNLARV